MEFVLFSGINLPFPKFLYGEYSEGSNVGVIILEDLYSTGHILDDTDIQRISNPARIESVIETLAEFHAASTAFERSAQQFLDPVPASHHAS